jgi:hypothetical protein
LGNAVFGLIPFAGAAFSGSFAGDASLFEALNSGSVVESMLDAGGNAQVLSTLTVVDRFFYGGRLVLKAEVLAQMPVEQRRVLEDAAAGLGMSLDYLRRLIVEAIGDGDATVIEDVVVEVVADQLEMWLQRRLLPFSAPTRVHVQGRGCRTLLVQETRVGAG